MKLFPSGHATHPQWRMAAGLAIAQVRAQMALPGFATAPRLGLLYITDHYAPEAQALLDHVREELPLVTDWVGCTGVGIAASGAEYWDEPALALMLCDLPPSRCRCSRVWRLCPPAGTHKPRWCMPSRKRRSWPS